MAAWRKPLQAEELVCMRSADRERKKENIRGLRSITSKLYELEIGQKMPPYSQI